MSHSGSHTPTNNPTISNINNPQSSASQPQILDDTPSAEHLIEDLARPPLTPPSFEPQIAESSSKRRTASESSTEKPMAKRIRRESPETRHRASRHNSSSSDLQDESDDMVEEKGKRQVPLASTTTPAKKKRTRTLTTPQQFAVLQALLAKSRFPTTAMREDVGRSIGLSARKVQIWFQNQRQKARRPRSQSDTPLTRPPQYGPYPPNVPGPSSSSRDFEEYPPARMPYTAQSTVPEVQPSQSDPPARLLGPGMPGPSIYNPHPYQRVPGPSTSAIPIESRFPGSHPLRRSESPRYYHSRSPRPPFHTSARYPTSQPSHWPRRERDPLRTLPPLVPSSSYSTRRTHAPSSSLPSRLALNLPYPISPESRFTRHVSPEVFSRPGITLPPPFAMQPSPQQWNPAPHPTPYRSEQGPISSLWSPRDSGSRSTIERSIPTVTAPSRREYTMEVSSADLPEAHHHPERAASPSHSASSQSIPPSSSLPRSRIGRYDPVRATFITRSSPTPTAPQAGSPAQQSDEDNEEEINKDRNRPVTPKENH